VPDDGLAAVVGHGFFPGPSDIDQSVARGESWLYLPAQNNCLQQELQSIIYLLQILAIDFDRSLSLSL
jgi:hypothetical protein